MPANTAAPRATTVIGSMLCSAHDLLSESLPEPRKEAASADQENLIDCRSGQSLVGQGRLAQVNGLGNPGFRDGLNVGRTEIEYKVHLATPIVDTEIVDRDRRWHRVRLTYLRQLGVPLQFGDRRPPLRRVAGEPSQGMLCGEAGDQQLFYDIPVDVLAA